MKKVIVITGPTASGKTSLSIKIAKHFNLEIINGDSVQIYKDYNIGSAKITKEEMEGITHHLLDIKEPGEPFSIFEYQKEVRNKIKELKIPLIVGGSGLYIQSALYDYQLHERQTQELPSVEQMKEALKKLDPKLDTQKLSETKIINAYQSALAGEKRSEKTNSKTPIYDLCILYLDIDRAILKKRVETRLEYMMEAHFLDEVKRIKQIPTANLNIIGYRQLSDYLDGKTDLETAKQLIITKTMQFAKRQKTWVKNQMEAHFLNALDDNLENQAIELITNFLKEKS
ncbi:MAG: tRNA (adenosine(37)-N6)-dimethylallyltransferase MiaA [Candidatus Phytoplasma sp.]|nr:tRNA (adenosine(37)-N6)-dimethylallyltransferase MiaA [Phytoplasma sp.]